MSRDERTSVVSDSLGLRLVTRKSHWQRRRWGRDDPSLCRTSMGTGGHGARSTYRCVSRRSFRYVLPGFCVMLLDGACIRCLLLWLFHIAFCRNCTRPRDPLFPGPCASVRSSAQPFLEERAGGTRPEASECSALRTSHLSCLVR